MKNPLKYEDRDYAKDGAEVYYAVFNKSYLTLNISCKDTDGDGIADGPEIYAFLYAYEKYEEGNETYANRSYWVDPMLYDSYNDSYSDGLTNIEEWERSGYIMDYDRDDIPNFYDTDDDNDSLPTSVELSADLNPFNRADAHGDKDSDGLDNLWEYENGTMITDADTDHDGINDGAEFKYWQNYLYNEWNTWENVNETAVEYLKNPDVDRDNVTDGKEINGWKVKVITGYDENNNPISKEVTLYGDPLKPYMDKNGNYIDADEDNIPDIVESLLSNNSTFLKFAQFFHNSNSEYYNKTIWDNYNWTIAYFYSIALKGSSLSDAEIKFYSILDNITSEPEYYIPFYEDRLRSKGNDKYTENATQWLRDEFNPLITESMPPVITQFAAVSDVGFFYAYTKVSVELRDPSGIGTVRLISKPEKNLPLIYDIRIFDGKGATIWKIKNLKLNITADAAAYHYFVVCNASDTLGNTAQWIKKVNGPVGAFVDTMAKLLSALWGFLCEVGKTLAKAVNILVDWIIEFFKGIVDHIIGPIINSVVSLVKEISDKIAEFITGGTTKGMGSSHSPVEQLASAITYLLLGSGIFLALVSLVVAIQIIMTITKSTPIGAATSMIIGNIKDIILGLILGTLISQLELSIFTGADMFKKIIPSEVDSGISTTFTLSQFIIALGIKFASLTRTLKTASKFFVVSLAVFITAIILLMGRRTALQTQTKLGYGVAIMFDIFTCVLAYKGWKELKPEPVLIRWYPALKTLNQIFGISAVVFGVTQLAEDILGFLQY